jgi:hypothetical protein
MSNETAQIVAHIKSKIEYHEKRAGEASTSFNLINLCKSHIDRRDELADLLQFINQSKEVKQ